MSARVRLCQDRGRGRAERGRDLLQKYGVKVRFVGRVEMLPEEVREAVRQMEEMTVGNRKSVC
jgi:ditrans,polycis-polyprenyl diphosphate synthase